MIGGVLAGFDLAVASWFPAGVRGVLLLGLWVWLTGGLHLDGWMDVADGFGSYRSRERTLEIMKDSRVGAMGVIAAILLLLLKASVLASTPDPLWIPLLSGPGVWTVGVVAGDSLVSLLDSGWDRKGVARGTYSDLPSGSHAIDSLGRRGESLDSRECGFLSSRWCRFSSGPDWPGNGWEAGQEISMEPWWRRRKREFFCCGCC